MKLVLSFSFCLILLSFFTSSISVHALNIGFQIQNSAISVRKECSRKCESEFCSVAPLLRYGKYCGFSYTGCSGEEPCDGLDACCMHHDACIQATNSDYLSPDCSKKLLNCIENFKRRGGPAFTFKGSKCKAGDVAQVISVAMDTALLGGKLLHQP